MIADYTLDQLYSHARSPLGLKILINRAFELERLRREVEKQITQFEEWVVTLKCRCHDMPYHQQEITIKERELSRLRAQCQGFTEQRSWILEQIERQAIKHGLPV